jgi:hypothetical protein
MSANIPTSLKLFSPSENPNATTKANIPHE